jgi:hypothetical protein
MVEACRARIPEAVDEKCGCVRKHRPAERFRVDESLMIILFP